MPAPAVLAAEQRHLLALLEQGLLLPRDVETSLARMRAALLAAIQSKDAVQ